MAEDFTAEELELLDPAPDIHALFQHYQTLYFDDKLGACSVEWSSARMTLCGGVCEWRPGGGCRIKLSEPLLKLRPTRDLKDVLLHEMAHAFMMLQGGLAGFWGGLSLQGRIRDNDPGGHGTIFKSIIQRINTSTAPDHQRPPGGYHVSVYHSMLAEVDHYRTHHWQCERCGALVKRAMNRPPQEADCRGRLGRGAACQDPGCRYHMHIKTCGGLWVKVKEPEGYKDRRKKAGSSKSAAAGGSSGTSGTDGAAARRPDGEPVPAKRRKKGGGGIPAAAAAGSHSITDFFKRPSQEGAAAAAAAAGAAGGSSGGGGGVLPALQAVAGTAAGPAAADQQNGQASPTPAEPSAEERRRLLAEAALRRLGRAGGLQQQQQPQPGQQADAQRDQLSEQLPAHGQQRQQQPQEQDRPQQQQQEVIDLLDSPDDSPLGPSLTERWQHRQQQQGAPPERPTSAAAGGGSHSGEPAEGSSGATLQCPICGQRWAAGELSNAQLNSHIDECLNQSYLDG